MAEDNLTKDQKYYRKNKGKRKRWYLERRSQAILICGGKCQECGETMPVVLEFHHCNGHDLNDDGSRKENNFQLIARIINSGKHPDDIQLLCKNCHELADIRDGTNIRLSRRRGSNRLG